jgi:hypothetical protein
MKTEFNRRKRRQQRRDFLSVNSVISCSDPIRVLAGQEALITVPFNSTKANEGNEDEDRI